MNHLPPETKRALVTDLHLRHVVALCPRQDPDWWDLNDAGTVSYEHWPLADGPTVPGWLAGCAAHLAAAVRRHEPVLVYCNQGRNRSALLAGLIVHDVTGTPGPDLVRMIRHARPGALANPAFTRYLEHLCP